MSLIFRFAKERKAAAAVEYGLIVSLVAVVITLLLTVTGCELNLKFLRVSLALS